MGGREGGTQKQTKGTKSADLWQWVGDKGEGGRKIRKICGRHKWKPPKNMTTFLWWIWPALITRKIIQTTSLSRPIAMINWTSVPYSISNDIIWVRLQVPFELFSVRLFYNTLIVKFLIEPFQGRYIFSHPVFSICPASKETINTLTHLCILGFPVNGGQSAHLIFNIFIRLNVQTTKLKTHIIITHIIGPLVIMVKRKMASDQWSNPKAGHTEYHMVKPITVENRYCDYPGNKGK